VVGGDGVGDGGPVGFGVGEDEESHGVECAGWGASDSTPGVACVLLD
jgi:hypothetical protein